jgi:hypothetical protein
MRWRGGRSIVGMSGGGDTCIEWTNRGAILRLRRAILVTAKDLIEIRICKKSAKTASYNAVYVLYKERNHMLLKHGLSTRTRMKRLLS